MRRSKLASKAHSLQTILKMIRDTSDDNPSASEYRREAFELISQLQRDGLVSAICHEGVYAIRHKTRGYAIFKNYHGREIYFASLRFARACKRVFDEVFVGGELMANTDLQILSVVD